jgi:formate dehydrogenase subunit gamma
MEKQESEVAAILARHHGREGALLPVLHEIQAAFGHIDDTAKRQVAHALNLSRAEVHGVASFYHDFRDAPASKPVLRLCRAEACQSRGSEKLAAEAEGMAGDKVTIEPVYCLGLCTVGPNAMIGDEVHARLDAERVSELIAGMAA